MPPLNYTPIDDLVKKSQKEPYDVTPGPTKEVASVSTRRPGEVSPKRAPLEKKPKEFEIHEVVEHEPEQEVREYVTARKETVEVPPDLQKMGVSSTTPTQYTAQQAIQLPISDDQVIQGLQAPITSSLRWLAEVCIYILKKAHLSLVRVGGVVKRVMTK